MKSYFAVAEIKYFTYLLCDIIAEIATDFYACFAAK